MPVLAAASEKEKLLQEKVNNPSNSRDLQSMSAHVLRSRPHSMLSKVPEPVVSNAPTGNGVPSNRQSTKSIVEVPVRSRSFDRVTGSPSEAVAKKDREAASSDCWVELGSEKSADQPWLKRVEEEASKARCSNLTEANSLPLTNSISHSNVSASVCRDPAPSISKSIADSILNKNIGVPVSQLLNICPDIGTFLTAAKSRHIDIQDSNLALVQELINHRLPVSVNGKSTMAILDGGSSKNIISSALLTADQEKRIENCSILIKLANGQLIKPKGEVLCMEIEVQTVPLKCDFIVLDSPGYDLLLGRPFLEMTRAITDWSTARYSFDLDYPEVETAFHAMDVLLVDSPESEDDVQPPSQEEDLKTTIKQRFPGLFVNDIKNLSQTNKMAMTIDTGQAIPVVQPMRRMPKSVLQEVTNQLLLYQEAGLIQDSQSPWASNILAVPKSDGSIRVVVDYRELNAVTKKLPSVIPHVEDILEFAAGGTVFSTLDAFSGYLQVPLEEKSRAKTAFLCPLGHKEWTVMPFGLSNAPAIFQSLMNRVLTPGASDCARAYVDDILIKSSAGEDHQEKVLKVCKLLNDAGISLNAKKCSLAKSELKLLGFTINSNGISITDPDKTRLSSFPSPHDREELRRLLGVFNYFRKFISDYAKLSAPLYNLLNSKDSFSWQQTHQQAFDALKKAFSEHATLTYPDPLLPFEVYCDASGYALGAALLQSGKFIAGASRLMTQRECNYHTTEREALAIVFALDKFRPYLLGAEFKLLSDHRCLMHLQDLPDPHGRIARWIVKLLEFGVRVHYVKGEDNPVADMFSRCHEVIEAFAAMSIKDRRQADLLTIRAILMKQISLLHLDRTTARRIKAHIGGYCLQGDVLYKKSSVYCDRQVILDETQQLELLKSCHDIGHQRADQLVALVVVRLY